MDNGKIGDYSIERARRRSTDDVINTDGRRRLEAKSAGESRGLQSKHSKNFQVSEETKT